MVDFKDDEGKAHSETLDALLPGEPFHVLPASDIYTVALLRRKLKRGLRDGFLSQAEADDLRETIKACSQWGKG